MNGRISTINIELTSRCNKECFMCGRRKIDKEFPEIAMNYGDMDFSLLTSIAKQILPGTVVQFHYNGEPLLYPKIKEALDLFPHCIRCLDTNGKLLVEKANDIIDRLDSITISVIENDKESNEQFQNVIKFLEIKGNKKPIMVYRLLGEVSCSERWYNLQGTVATRILHHPLGSYKYEKKTTVPEIGICLEVLHHIAIDRFGKVHTCVRFDPKNENVIGDLTKDDLFSILNGKERTNLTKAHKEGRRKEIPFCNKCDFWGVPRGN